MKMIRMMLCLALVVSSAAPAYSHQPQEITISISGQNVDVEVSHPVSDPADHYIKTIRVSLNNTLLITQTFFLQTGNTQTARYSIPGMKQGDVVTVQADCSKYGSLERSRKAE